MMEIKWLTIVNEFKPAGEYNFEYNTVNLTSGIYYLSLYTGDNVEVKKFVVIK